MKIDYPKNITKDAKEEYLKICYKIWGIIPVDYQWAISTGLYRQTLIEITKTNNYETTI
jgi:hypothetical protein